LIQEATDIRIRAGEVLAEMKARGARRRKGQPKIKLQAATLSDLGVSKTQSSRWQKLAALPRPAQERKIDRANEQVRPRRSGSPIAWASPPSRSRHSERNRPMAELGDKVSLLWRARQEADIARARTLSPEDVRREIGAAGRREAEGFAAVKAGRGTMGVRRSPENGPKKGAPAAWDGAGSAVEGVESIPEGGGENGNVAALLQPVFRAASGASGAGRWPRADDGARSSAAGAARVAAWQAATSYKRRTLNPPAQPDGKRGHSAVAEFETGTRYRPGLMVERNSNMVPDPIP
jgi:hypothetical protein